MKKKYYSGLILCLAILFLSSFFMVLKFYNLGDVKYNLSTDKSRNIVIEDAISEKNINNIPSAAATAVNEPIKQLPVEVILSSVGDVTLGTDDNFAKNTSLPIVYQNSNDPEYLFKNVADIFKNDDITTANLETTFTTATTKREKKFNFKGDPSLANALVLGNIDAVNLSNNHIYDYNQQGFKDTIKTLENYRINYFGEGNIWLTTVKGVKFGFLGYQGWTNDKNLLNKIKSDIAALKKENFIVIINFHWGEERKYTPNSIQKFLAHYAIDNGADLVIGHHPHVIQGIEKYKNRFIAYSLGNFCFGGNSNPSDKDTFILQTKFKVQDKKLTSIGVRVIPSSISSVSYKNDYSPTPLTGTEKTRVLNKLNKLNINMNTNVSEEFIFIDLN